MYETDFILQPRQDFPISFNANQNLYNVDPFNRMGVNTPLIGMPKEEPEKLVSNFFGLNLFNTNAVAERVDELDEY